MYFYGYQSFVILWIVFEGKAWLKERQGKAELATFYTSSNSIGSSPFSCVPNGLFHCINVTRSARIQQRMLLQLIMYSNQIRWSFWLMSNLHNLHHCYETNSISEKSLDVLKSARGHKEIKSVLTQIPQELSLLYVLAYYFIEMKFTCHAVSRFKPPLRGLQEITRATNKSGPLKLKSLRCRFPPPRHCQTYM